MNPKGAKYYDITYKKIEQSDLSLQWIQERNEAVIPHIKGSVLDLGCGLGEIADFIDDNHYYGVDFSQVAIKKAQAKTQNKKAIFACRSFDDLEDGLYFDTVLLLEVLEHLDNKTAKMICDYAIRHARKQVIVTVPVDMPGKSHVKPRWELIDLYNLIGHIDYVVKFGGNFDDRWWLAIKYV